MTWQLSREACSSPKDPLLGRIEDEVAGPFLFPFPSRASWRASVFAPHVSPLLPPPSVLHASLFSFSPSLLPACKGGQMEPRFLCPSQAELAGCWGASLPLMTPVELRGINRWESGRETLGLLAGSCSEPPPVPRGGEHHRVRRDPEAGALSPATRSSPLLQEVPALLLRNEWALLQQ